MESELNLAGQRFGHLVVICPHKFPYDSSFIMWDCLCDCGNPVTIEEILLLEDRGTYCGDHVQDFTGQTIGQMVIVQRLGEEEEKLEYKQRKMHHKLSGGFWRSVCQCGQPMIWTVNGLLGALKRGYVCEHRPKTAVKVIIEGMDCSVEWTAKMRQELRRLFPECVVCGMTEVEHLAQHGQRLHVDHVFPRAKGYKLFPGNAVVLCRQCNLVKRDYLLGELPERMRLPILAAAQKFKEYWDSLVAADNKEAA